MMWSLILFLFSGWKCPWCGVWLPLGKPDWGPRTAENKRWCKRCGRKV
jgi:hypothetical protein